MHKAGLIRHRLQILLLLITLHSVLVGLGLIILPPQWMHFFGYDGYDGRFFQMQGGVFHVVIGLVYLLAGLNPDRFRNFTIFAIFAKGSATFFLITYYFFLEPVWLVLISGLSDGLMCGALFYLLKLYSSALTTLPK